LLEDDARLNLIATSIVLIFVLVVNQRYTDTLGGTKVMAERLLSFARG